MAKIAIINYSGSVGKTVAASHLFAPRMPGALFIAVETINQSAADLGVKNVEKLRGNNVGDLIEKLVFADDAIIDIGASNIETFLETASRFAGAIEDIDLFVIPVTSEQKAWQESLKTVEALAAVGIAKDKIILLPNRIERNAEEEIPAIFKYVEKSKKARIVKGAYIYDSEIYGYLSHKKISFDDLLNDNLDYRQMARDEKDEEKAKEYAKMYRWTKMAIPVRNNLDDVYSLIAG